MYINATRRNTLLIHTIASDLGAHNAREVTPSLDGWGTVRNSIPVVSMAREIVEHGEWMGRPWVHGARVELCFNHGPSIWVNFPDSARAWAFKRLLETRGVVHNNYGMKLLKVEEWATAWEVCEL